VWGCADVCVFVFVRVGVCTRQTKTRQAKHVFPSYCVSETLCVCGIYVCVRGGGGNRTRVEGHGLTNSSAARVRNSKMLVTNATLLLSPVFSLVSLFIYVRG